jgi:FSR family fosmidomycin resistance protein-like MFS transporter
MLAAGPTGTITGGRLADRFGRLPVIRVSFAVTALGLLAIALAGLPWVFLATALTRFAVNQSFSLTVTPSQDYLPTRIAPPQGHAWPGHQRRRAGHPRSWRARRHDQPALPSPC